MIVFDSFQFLASRANPAVAVLTNSDGTELELLPITPRAISDADLDSVAQQWAGRGLQFAGVVGRIDGVVQTALDMPLDAVQSEALSAAFARHCERIETAELEPEYDWAARQYRLVPRIH